MPSAATLRAETARGWVAVDFVAEGVARVRITASKNEEPAYSYAVDRNLPALPARLDSSETELSLHTDHLSVFVDRRSGAISARDATNAPLVTETAHGYAAVGAGHRWQIRLAEGEACHGLGDRAFPLSLRGRTLRLWNYDARTYRPGTDPLYLSVPFYLGHRAGVSYGIFWDCPARGVVDLGDARADTLGYSTEYGPVCVYLVSGESPQQVVERYVRLTGPMELPPVWALGYHQSRWGFRDAAHISSVAGRFRRERIPCDAIHFDIDYMDGFRIFTWDESRFPDPARLLGDLRNQGFETVAILDPGVKVDQKDPTFRDGSAHDVYLRDASGRPVRREVWPGTCQFPDFTDPGGRRWWSEHVARFVAVGFAGLWNDMNEPSTFDDPSRSLPDTVHHDWEGEGNSHVRGGHAVYGMQMARSSRDGLAAARPQKRPFVLTRAGYAGVQRYAATWTGDSRSSWEHLRMTIPQLCNLAISGISFSGSDAGGFRGEPGAELYLRWMQLASMTPFFRTHSAITSTERNPWSYGEPTTGRIRSVIERRYRLLPYLYTQMHRAATAGTPVMRPMFFEQPDAKDYSRIDDQFMLGDSLLVAPILEPGGRARIVRLPPGTWYDFETGRAWGGARSVVVEAGWDLPIFVRAGAVVPLWPVRQSTATPVGSSIFHVYSGSASSTLYEDAGDGLGYRHGDFLLSTFTTVLGPSGLEVVCRTEGEYVRPSQDVEVRVLGLGTVPRQVLRDGSPVAFRVESDAVVLEGGAFERLTLST